MRPEQERALAYLDRKGTSAPAQNVLRDVTSAVARIENRLEELSTLPTAKRPTPDQWSLLEIVDHLIESHRPAVAQLNAALHGADPGDAIPAGLQSAEPLAGGWLDRVADLEAVHADFLEALSRGEDSSPPSTIPIVMVVKAKEPDGTVNALEWIEHLHWKAFAVGVKAHTLEHLAQIERVFGLLSADPSPAAP